MRRQKQIGFIQHQFNKSRKIGAGFTLIEVMIVMAISSLLAVILLGMYGRNQARSQFTDSMERALTTLEKTKTESNSTFTNTTTGGTNSARVFFGKAIFFIKDSDDKYTIMRTVTLSANRTDDGSVSGIGIDSRVDTDLKWGLFCETNCDQASVFTRLQTDGILNTYVLGSSSDSVLVDGNSYSTAADSASVEYQLNSQTGLTGSLFVHGGSGELKRSYTN